MFKRLEKKDSFTEKDVYKVIVIGDSGCGKTSLSQKYARNYFSEEEENTIGVSYLTKQYNDEETGKIKKICIWDTAGQERFFSLIKLYFKHARGVICVYDVSRLNTLKNCEMWLSQIMEYISNEDNYIIPVVLVGNKSDIELTEINKLAHDNMVKEYIKNYNLTHFYTSAKTGENIENMMNHLIRNMIPNVPDDRSKIYIGSDISEKTCYCI